MGLEKHRINSYVIIHALSELFHKITYFVFEHLNAGLNPINKSQNSENFLLIGLSPGWE